MYKGGQIGMIKSTILSSQGLPLINLKVQSVASGGDKFTSSVLLGPEVCHYTTENSPLSQGMQNTMLPPQRVSV